MSKEFVREERYIVFKMSELGNSLKGDEIRRLAREYAEQRRLKGKKPLECVVVEKDWPEYEPTWKAIEARVTGAQLAPNAVAYLDLGVGGYMGIGTDLTDEELDAIPKGRHMLGIVGTYGIDGYVPAQLAPSVPREAIEKMLTQLMDIAVSNGANSVSMPDEYVEVAAWLCGIPAQPVPSVPMDVIADYLVSISAHLARRDDAKAQAEIGELLKMIAAAPEAKPGPETTLSGSREKLATM